MNRTAASRWAVACAAALAALFAGIALTAQGQQRVQSTTQRAVAEPVAADALSDWRAQYEQALQLTAELAESGSVERARMIEYVLEGLEDDLREYQRVSERLRHKDRALEATVAQLDASSAIEARLVQALSNLQKTARDATRSAIQNVR